MTVILKSVGSDFGERHKQRKAQIRALYPLKPANSWRALQIRDLRIIMSSGAANSTELDLAELMLFNRREQPTTALMHWKSSTLIPVTLISSIMEEWATRDELYV